MSLRRADVALLVGVGLIWGGGFTLTRLIMETGLDPLRMAFWHAAASAVALWIAVLAAGAAPRIDGAYIRFCLLLGVLGGAIPNLLIFWAAGHVGAGVLAVCMATVPLILFGICAVTGVERFSARRSLGLLLGLSAVVVIARPESGGAPAFWVAVTVGAAMSYALEGLAIAVRRPAGIGPFPLLAGMMAAATLLSLPLLAVAEGPGLRETLAPALWLVFACNILCNMIAYAGYVSLTTSAGPVFAAQVSYVVTAAGVAGGAVFLGESHGLAFWFALALMAVGLALGLPGGWREASSAPAPRSEM